MDEHPSASMSGRRAADAECVSAVSVVVRAALSEYFSLATDNPRDFIRSARTVLVLVRNALASSSSGSDDRRRRVRLSNPRVLERVVTVPGALDAMSIAGFVRNRSADGEDVLLFSPSPEEDGGGAGAGGGMLAAAEAVVVAIEEELAKAEARVGGGGGGKGGGGNEGDGEGGKIDKGNKNFLTDEERKERARRSKEARKARETERAVARKRWEEDKRDREEKEARKATAKRAAAFEGPLQPDGDGAAVGEGITIRSLRSAPRPASAPLSVPLLPLASAQNTSLPAIGDIAEVAGTRGAEKSPQLRPNEAAAAAAARRLGSGLGQNFGGEKTDDLSAVAAEDRPSGANENLPGVTPADEPMDIVAVKPCESATEANATAKETVKAKTEEMEEDRKPAASRTSQPPPPSESWESVLERIPRCSPAPGVRDSSTFNKVSSSSTTSSSARPSCIRRLHRELRDLGSSLPCDVRASMWVRHDEDCPQFLRALIAAPLPGPTPYAGGAFVFDVYLPDDYPSVPPQVRLLTTGGGTVRFGPNLYADGKVCLSLLGTWDGPKWDPRHSTLLQVLVSIQGLILGSEHPYFLEPGHGGWEGSVREGDFKSTGRTLSGKAVEEELSLPPEAASYEDGVRLGTARFALLEAAESLSALPASSSSSSLPPSSLSSTGDAQIGRTTAKSRILAPFVEPLRAHFVHNRGGILSEVRSWLEDRPTAASASSVSPWASKMSGLPSRPEDSAVRERLAVVLARLEIVLEDLPASDQRPTRLPGGDAAPFSSAPAMSATMSATAEMTAGGDGCDATGMPKTAAASPEQAPENEGGAMKPAAKDEKESATAAASASAEAQATKSDGGTVDDDDSADALRRRMHAAAEAGNYVLAGRLQETVQSVEDLERRMAKAAAKRDYVKAGRLQEQLRALVATETDSKEGGNGVDGGGMEGMDPFEDDNEGVGDGNSEFGEGDNNMWVGGDDEDEDMMGGMDMGMGMAAGAGTVPMGGYGQGKLWFPPAGHHTRTADARHSWGAGHSLNSTSSSAVAAATPTAVAATGSDLTSAGAAQTSTAERRAVINPCRLRIRLPGSSKSVTEDFDRDDKLSAVYQWLEPQVAEAQRASSRSSGPGSVPFVSSRAMVQPPGAVGLNGLQAVVPSGGAFAQPLSLAGFTLLLSRPRREFNLEMHGSRSLSELGLSPSAALTVMLCAERGVVRRGELEGRLAEAQGDAMEVDGLGYEGLLELGERVGVASPGDGSSAWETVELGRVSTLISPSDLLDLRRFSGAGNSQESSGGGHDRSCPICLGDFDPKDTEQNLRRLNNCSHVFHAACLSTWLTTKAACPICKQSLVP